MCTRSIEGRAAKGTVWEAAMQSLGAAHEPIKAVLAKPARWHTGLCPLHAPSTTLGWVRFAQVPWRGAGLNKISDLANPDGKR
jgi:hypothetical protein